MSQTMAIIVGSVLGASEYVAEALEPLAQDAGFSTSLHFEPDLSTIDLAGTWLVCTSTHGAGELPQNIQHFARTLDGKDLSAVSVYLVGLGDSSYDTFCYGAIEMEKKLTAAGATLLRPALHIDVLNHPIPEDVAVEWFKSQLSQ